MQTKHYAIRRTNIIGTTEQVFSAWAVDGDPRHSTVTHIGEVRYGRVGTEWLPAEIDALEPFSVERSDAYHAWRQETYRKAYGLIRRAFLEPDGIDGAFGYDMGEVRWAAPLKGSETRFVEA